MNKNPENFDPERLNTSLSQSEKIKTHCKSRAFLIGALAMISTSFW